MWLRFRLVGGRALIALVLVGVAAFEAGSSPPPLPVLLGGEVEALDPAAIVAGAQGLV